MNLEELLTQKQVAARRSIEDAVARQSLYGSDLLTNLIEVAELVESEALEALALYAGRASAPPGELEPAEPEVLRLVPAELAIQAELYPLRVEGAILVLGVAQALSAQQRAELEFSLQLGVAEQVTLRLRLLEALARDYGHTLDLRHARALSRLKGESPPTGRSSLTVFGGNVVSLPSSPPLPQELSLNEPESWRTFPGAQGSIARLPPVDLGPARTPDSAEARTALPQTADTPAPSTHDGAHPRPVLEVPHAGPADPGFDPRGVQQSATTARPTLTAVKLGHLVRAAAPERRRGPYPLNEALEDLKGAGAGNEAFRVFVDFCAQYFDYLALFLVHSEFAEGHDARGSGPGREQVRGIGLSLELPSVIERAVVVRAPLTTQFSDSGLDRRLQQDLQRRATQSCLLLPVQLAERVVAVLYADNGSEPVDVASAGDVVALVTQLEAALERIIWQRKLGAQTKAARETPALGISAESRTRALLGALTPLAPAVAAGQPPAPDSKR